ATIAGDSPLLFACLLIWSSTSRGKGSIVMALSIDDVDHSHSLNPSRHEAATTATTISIPPRLARTSSHASPLERKNHGPAAPASVCQGSAVPSGPVFGAARKRTFIQRQVRLGWRRK